MMLAAGGLEAFPGGRSICPGCRAEVIAKCGQIKVPHWAHRVNDCDSWAEPETAWHRNWKLLLREKYGATLEVVMGNGEHRADAVLPDGTVVELQHSYLDGEQIHAREKFYGRMIWIYDCHWMDRLEFSADQHRFWWKNGSKAQAEITQPLCWDTRQDQLLSVQLRLNKSGYRIYGKVLARTAAYSWNPSVEYECRLIDAALERDAGAKAKAAAIAAAEAQEETRQAIRERDAEIARRHQEQMLVYDEARKKRQAEERLKGPREIRERYFVTSQCRRFRIALYPSKVEKELFMLWRAAKPQPERLGIFESFGEASDACAEYAKENPSGALLF